MRIFASVLLSLIWAGCLHGQTAEVNPSPTDPYQEAGPIPDADPAPPSGNSWLKDLLNMNLDDGKSDSAVVMADTIWELIHSGDIGLPAVKFSRFDSPVTIGILGNIKDPVTQSVMIELKKKVEGKTVLGGRSVVITEFSDIDEARKANILWISKLETEQLTQLVARLQGSKIVTISDQDGFVSKGGMIELKLDKTASGSHLQFNVIDIHQAQKEGILISPDVLELTHSVL